MKVFVIKSKLDKTVTYTNIEASNKLAAEYMFKRDYKDHHILSIKEKTDEN